MAKRKKSRDTYTSKGQGRNVRKDITNKPYIRVPAEQVWRKERYIMRTKDPMSV